MASLGLNEFNHLGAKFSKIPNAVRFCEVYSVILYDIIQAPSQYKDGLSTLQWRHNGCDSISNHQPHHCLLNRLFRGRSKKTSKLRVTGLCAGNSLETGEFTAQMASNVEKVSIWWHHYASIGIPIIKIRWSWNSFIFIMGIPILIIWYLYIEIIWNHQNWDGTLVTMGYSKSPVIKFHWKYMKLCSQHCVCICPSTIKCWGICRQNDGRGSCINIGPAL